MKINEIINYLEQFAPKNLAESWDNVGLLVGDKSKEVANVLLALDITDEVIDEAIENNVNLIITHHPMIFKAIKNITNSDAVGKRLIKLIKNDISVYTLHTNLDSAQGGTNDVLAEILNLQNINVLEPIEGIEKCGLGRVGTVEDGKVVSVKDIMVYLKDSGHFDYINYAEDFEGLDKKVTKIGLCTGSVMNSLIYKAKAEGCDLYITGDLTYHSAQIAKDIGITIVDVGHYCSENIVFESIKIKLETVFTDVKFLISKVNSQTIKNF